MDNLNILMTEPHDKETINVEDLKPKQVIIQLDPKNIRNTIDF